MSVLDYIISKNVLSLYNSESFANWLAKYDEENYEKGNLAELFNGDFVFYADFFRDLEEEDLINESNIKMDVIKKLKPTKREIREFNKAKTSVYFQGFVNFNVQLHGKVYPNEKNQKESGFDLILDLESSLDDLHGKFEEFINSYEGASLISTEDATEYGVKETEVKVEYSKVHKKYYGVIDFDEKENSRFMSLRVEIEYNPNSDIKFEDFFFEYKQENDITFVANIYSLVKSDTNESLIRNKSLC